MRISAQFLSQIGHHVDSRVRRYRGVFYWQAYKQYKRWLLDQSYEIPNDMPLVVFDFSHTRIDGPQGRRFYALFIYFVRAGYYPVLKENYLFLSNIHKRYKAYCLDEQFSLTKSVNTLPREYVLVTDRTNHSQLNARVIKRITIDYRPDYKGSDGCFPMPFPMFPSVYRSGQDSYVAQARAKPKLWKVLFGGDTQTQKYSQSTIADIYKKIPRARVLSILKSSLARSLWFEPRNQAELDGLVNKPVNGLLVINTRDCKINATDWLQTIAKSRFFLACPGVRYPMSHNVIEALAVGCVPITQYPELFYPALEHDVNCLAYSNQQELIEVLKRAMDMQDQEVARLSSSAAEYYDRFLAPAATVQRILAHGDKHINIRLLPFLKKGGGFA